MFMYIPPSKHNFWTCLLDNVGLFLRNLLERRSHLKRQNVNHCGRCMIQLNHNLHVIPVLKYDHEGNQITCWMTKCYKSVSPFKHKPAEK